MQRRANDILKSKNGFLFDSSEGRRIPLLKTWPSPQRLTVMDATNNSHTPSVSDSTMVTMPRGTSNMQTTVNHQSGDNSTLQSHSQYTHHTNNHINRPYELDKTQSSAVSMAVAAAAAAYGNFPRASDNSNTTAQKMISYHPTGSVSSLTNYSTPLPSPPSFHHLEDIADTLVSLQVSMTHG